MKGKYLIKLIAFYDEITNSEGIAYLDFCRAFHPVSCNILIENLKKCGLEKWTLKQLRRWLNCQD